MLRDPEPVPRGLAYTPGMARIHLIEIHEQSWCPAFLRDGTTEYLEFVIRKGRFYQPVAERLIAAVRRVGARRITDLCSGSGGPWVSLHQAFADAGIPVEVTLTDLYPNVAAFERVQSETGLAVELRNDPVDATRVPADMGEFRTLFSSFHHFQPAAASAILASAVKAGAGIAVFEASKRSLGMLIGSLLVPLMVLVATPFMRPFRVWRLLLTYLIPILPLLIWFDGAVSCLRTYSPDELRDLVAEMDAGADDYEWDIGEIPASVGRSPITYLIGTPRTQEPST